MKQSVIINSKIRSFNKIIHNVANDKSLSIRFLLIASLAKGISKVSNLLNSEDVFSTINCLKKLGVKIEKKQKYYYVYGLGLGNFKKKKNIVLNAGNSGTLARLLFGMLSNYSHKIKIVGDQSLSKRDFKRVIDPMIKFGVKFYPKNKFTLPISLKGSNSLQPINYFEKKGSAQVKSSIMLAALNTDGTTKIKAKKSRNHTENLFKYLKVPISIKKDKSIDYIKIKKPKNLRSFEYKVPSDISSSLFFLSLAILTKNSQINIKNVNINFSRTGALDILKLMGVKILFKNKKKYKGEDIADILIRTPKKIKPINCPIKFNSRAIDEFLIIFLIAAKANGISYFSDLSELNQKESPRLKIASKILNDMGIKTILTDQSIKIFGNPELIIKKKITIKNFMKDHRVFMMSTIAALAFGGYWKINDLDSINTSFPNFLEIIKKVGGNFKIKKSTK